MSDPRILAIARCIETQLPSSGALADHLAEIEDGSADMGPQVMLPAVFVRILTTAYRAEALEREHDAMQAKLARAARKPTAVLDDEQAMALSVHLANEADASTFDPLDAAAALWRAAATIAVAHLPSSTALGALDSMHAVVRADVAQAIGIEVTRQ